jgi:hypothetical protein
MKTRARVVCPGVNEKRTRRENRWVSVTPAPGSSSTSNHTTALLARSAPAFGTTVKLDGKLSAPPRLDTPRAQIDVDHIVASSDVPVRTVTTMGLSGGTLESITTTTAVAGEVQLVTEGASAISPSSEGNARGTTKARRMNR